MQPGTEILWGQGSVPAPGSSVWIYTNAEAIPHDKRQLGLILKMSLWGSSSVQNAICLGTKEVENNLDVYRLTGYLKHSRCRATPSINRMGCHSLFHDLCHY